MNLDDIGEFGFIARIRKRAGSCADLVLGIGDDCAVSRLKPGELLLTSTDLLIEDVHFRRAWSDLKTLGRKSVSVNVSDVAAMGGRPFSLYLGLGIPAGWTLEELDAFADGVVEACAAYGAVLAGGDTCRSPGPLFISVTVEGRVPEGELVSRAGARPGDLLWVSGSLGDSALALRELLAGRRPDVQSAARHHDPCARVALGRALAAQGLATSMIDVSDGLLADLGHLLDSSAVGARVARAALPVSSFFRAALREDPSLMDLALSGGEDYELLFTSPPEQAAAVSALVANGVAVTQIGHILPQDDGLQLVDAQGNPCPLPRSGFDHFG
ncbi:thiamine-phosphate kinase [Geoalkalibacter ferrihydriticus]|uniref:Thiamine-monophosphate kinase n=2 Tax=Geoalkalibacter ferrihydriticus TaxID=392333 RepID=A0A0C2HYG0_9BACT|nr:thiamine-phosphate kinase [Geoalkalibacter ferrihydriticus]KIH77787.1 thiamine-monophosphate kinase [Geoalkalibacter ferrihydriticus DSM 17813]SDL79154.1 thiamine-phosphate kinase [Geoalkalibacter ferrihydriticus]